MYITDKETELLSSLTNDSAFLTPELFVLDPPCSYSGMQVFPSDCSAFPNEASTVAKGKTLVGSESTFELFWSGHDS